MSTGSTEAEGLVDETDAGKPRALTVRTCVATRVQRPVGELIRFVVDPSGQLVPDLKAVLPGRGVWVSATSEAIRLALKKKAFARGLKREVTITGDLADRVDALLTERARQALAIANKAGEVVTGSAKVEAAARAGAVALLHAADASEDGARKLDRLHNGLVFGLLDGPDLDLALGRANVVHVALVGGPASAACIERFHMLLRYRAGANDDTTAAALAPVAAPAGTGRE